MDADIMAKIEEELKTVENGNGHSGEKEEEPEVEESVPEPQSLVTNNLPDEVVTA